MTETELTDRLREAIVLNGPDVWRNNGYLQDAQQAGLSLADALKRATELNQEVANNNLLFQNIQARIARLAQPSRSHLIDQDQSQIVNAASSLKLSADFVRNQWVPAVLQRLAVAAKAQQTEPAVVPTPPAITEQTNRTALDDLVKSEPESPKPAVTLVEPIKPTSPTIEPFVPVVPPVVTVERPVAPKGPPEPPPIVRSFTATPARVSKGQPVTLAWEVENLLAITIDDLGEGLSPVNRGWVKPQKTTDYTLFDANDNPLSTVHVEVIKPDRSGIYGVLFALALLAVIYWFIKSSNSSERTPKAKHKTERTTGSSSGEGSSKKTNINREDPQPEAETKTTEATDTPAETTSEPTVTIPLPDKPNKVDLPVSKPVEEKIASSEPETKPASPSDARQGKYEEAFGDKPYDKVELGADERGWRRARSKGRWGYINERDEWVIQPEFEAVTPFRGSTASVFLNGQLMTINRTGEQVRN
ncbi:WG repeat-containing protein [Spirosoma flavum]|uniref:WG repeat-containing protein n=1 Tax=Spirosoma flavum TaxID=2048557 RepID=A0ABW6ADF7_9BACT